MTNYTYNPSYAGQCLYKVLEKYRQYLFDLVSQSNYSLEVKTLLRIKIYHLNYTEINFIMMELLK